MVNVMIQKRAFFRSGRLQNLLGRDGMPSASPNDSGSCTLLGRKSQAEGIGTA